MATQTPPGTAMHRFLEVLSEGPLLFDGAIGTEFYRRGIYLTKSFEELNLIQPHLVRSVHEEYVKSGAQVITTNSYGANRLRLGRFGLEDKCAEINLAAARIAREAAGEAIWVAGSVGPSGAEGARILGPGAREVKEAFAAQIDALIEGGVDASSLRPSPTSWRSGWSSTWCASRIRMFR